MILLYADVQKIDWESKKIMYVYREEQMLVLVVEVTDLQLSTSLQNQEWEEGCGNKVNIVW